MLLFVNIHLWFQLRIPARACWRPGAPLLVRIPVKLYFSAPEYLRYRKSATVPFRHGMVCQGSASKTVKSFLGLHPKGVPLLVRVPVKK